MVFETQNGFMSSHFVGYNKDDLLMYKVKVIEANPHYTAIRHPDGKESTISLGVQVPSVYVPTTNIVHKEGLASCIPITTLEDCPVGIVLSDTSMDLLWTSDLDYLLYQRNQFQSMQSDPDVDV